MCVLVLQGGDSSEREVSIRSAQSIIRALKQRGCSVVTYDPVSGLDGLSELVGKVEVVFPALHGQHGEDGMVQAELERLGLAYVGADAKVSELCFNKHLFREAVRYLGMTVPGGQVVDLHSVFSSPLTTKPFVLKPVDGGSSIDMYICKNPDDCRVNFDEVFSRHDQMLMEELVEGSEITVPVLLDQALPVIEIIPPAGEDFDYENKYNGKTQENCPPTKVSEKLQQQAQAIALSIHQELGVRHLSRIDMIIGHDGAINVLELNTMPGMTEHSLFPKSANAVGISMSDLVHSLIQAAAR